MTTGVSTPKMPAHMESTRQELLAQYLGAVENPNIFDEMALRRTAAIEAKFLHAISDPDCPSSTLDILTRILHRELKALKVTREQQQQSSSGTTPAEVIAALIKRVHDQRARADARQIAAAVSSDVDSPIDAEFEEVPDAPKVRPRRDVEQPVEPEYDEAPEPDDEQEPPEGDGDAVLSWWP